MSENAFAKKYKNWSDCREDHSKNWCKKYFKKDNNGNKNGGNKDGYFNTKNIGFSILNYPFM
jgi:hypothetical protein